MSGATRTYGSALSQISRTPQFSLARSRLVSYLRLDFRGGAVRPCQLTIVAGVRERVVVTRRGR